MNPIEGMQSKIKIRLLRVRGGLIFARLYIDLTNYLEVCIEKNSIVGVD